MKVLSFGEVLWDIYGSDKFIGGAPFNFAAHFIKNGGEASICTSVGNDELGKETLSYVKLLNVSVKYVTVNKNKQTGKCLVKIDDKGKPTYNILNDVSYDYISTKNIDEDFDALYFGTLALRSQFNIISLKELLSYKKFKEVFVDVNIRPPYYSDKVIEFSLSNASILKISAEELPIILKALKINVNDDYKLIAKLICEKYPQIKLVLITDGENGSYLYNSKNNQLIFAEAIKTKVTSTVGAGDSYSATFLYNYLIGESLESSISNATRVASFVVSREEAIPNYN